MTGGAVHKKAEPLRRAGGRTDNVAGRMPIKRERTFPRNNTNFGYRGIHEKGSGDVVPAVCGQRE